MITKVVLGVALVLIEFSILTLSQNNSLSSHNESSSTSTSTEFSSISDFTTTTESYDTTAAVVTAFKIPENCSSYKVSFAVSCAKVFSVIHKHFLASFKLLKDQPEVLPSSSIKKCCPLHQNYKYDYGKRSCANSTVEFEVSAIKARFYENCIEDEEANVTISVVVENNCRK